MKRKKATIVILVFAMILIIMVTMLFYLVLNKKEPNDNKVDNVESSNILSNDEAIAIAKQKLDEANNFLDDSTRSSSEEYGSEGEATEFIYYDMVDNFKKDFYKIYSNQLSYKDVFLEYNLDSNVDPNYVTNVTNVNLIHDVVRGYAIKDGKVYTNSCYLESRLPRKNDNFTVESITADTIKVNYGIFDRQSEENDTLYESDNGQIVLVKENNEWKILKATIKDMCNGTYEIGK